ncbi:hypothetical protein DL93DRAFT_2073716 [Clavulina sp. PMI_390]|nr:hypothetical protein DL93DRAFT_2073716 [Clavulina sp. PMI_390]
MSDHSLTGSATAINSGFGGFGSTPRPVSPPLRRTNTAPMSSNAPTAGRSDTRRSSAGSPVPSSSTPYPMTSALTSPRSPSPTSPSPLLTPTTNSPSTPFAPPHPARRSMAITPSPLAHSINISPPSSPPSTIRRTAPTSPGMRSDDGDEYEESTPLMQLAPPPAAVISPMGKGPVQSLPVLERQRLSTLYEPPGSEYRSSRGSDLLRELEIAEASSIRKSVSSSKKTAKRRGRRPGGGGGSDDEEDEDEDEYELAPLAPPPPISTLAVPRSRPRSHPHAQQHAGYGNRTASNTSSSTQSSGIERVMHVDGVPVPLAPGSFKVTSHHESPPGTPNSLQTSAALPTP